MSALEQIRKRPAITIGIIGFALILFLFTGINGCDRLIGRNRENIAKVDGEKIKYTELDQATQRLSENYKQQYGQNPDESWVRQQALEQLIEQKLLEKEFSRLGIAVTDAEISDIIFGPAPNAYFSPEMQAQNREMYQFAQSNDPNAPYAQARLDQYAENLRQELPMQKYITLLGAITANKLDAQSVYNDKASSTVYIASQNVMSVPDDQVKVSDDEIKARYEKDKARYRIDRETTDANYIYIPARPSDADFMAAQQEIEEIIPALASKPGLEAIANNYNFTSSTVKGSRATLASQRVGQALDSIVSRGAYLISGGENYTIGKLLDTSSASEKAKVEFYTTTSVNNDSIVKLLNAGTPVESITEIAAIPNNPVDFDLISNPLASVFVDAATGSFISAIDPQGMPFIARVVEKTAPETIYEIAVINRPVEASSETFNNLLDDLTAYVTANTTADAFKANALKSNYDVLSTPVYESSLSVLNLPSTGRAAKWATNAKKGAVSEVYYDDSRTYLLALAVADRFDNYRPYTNENVNNELRSRILNEKKADKILADIKGKGNDVDSYAKAMNVTPVNRDINHSNTSDAALAAAVAHAKKGQFVGPIKTLDGVVVFKVEDVRPTGRDFDAQRDGDVAKSRLSRLVQGSLANILRSGKSITYSVQDLYGNN